MKIIFKKFVPKRLEVSQLLTGVLFSPIGAEMSDAHRRHIYRNVV